MTTTVLVRCGESEAQADLFHEVIKSTWKDFAHSIQWQLPYAFVELPKNINLNRFRIRLEEIGMALWLAVKVNEDDGHSEVVYNRKGVDTDTYKDGIEMMQHLVEIEHRRIKKSK